jgi:iron complex outermembrane recepter protein
MKTKRFLLSSLFTLFLLPVFSQESLTDTISIDEVVVTASKTPQSPGNITQKIDIIDSRAINHVVSENRNISEAIRYRPGLSVTALSRNDANWGTYSGIGGKYGTYMLQGLPIDAYIDPMNIDLSAVSRIEVQRGPASVLYPNYLSQDFAGSQSPLAGTVNLILKEKIDRSLTRFSTSYGSYNTFNSQFFHEGHLNSLNFFAGANYESSDYTNYGTDPSWLNMKKDPAYKKTKLFGGLTWFSDGSKKQKFTLFVNKTIHRGDAGRVYRGFDHDYETVNAGYSIDINDKINLQSHVGLRQYDRTWQESNFGIVDTLKSNNGVVQSIVPADITLTVKHGGNNIFTIGSDYQAAGYTTWSDPLRGYRSYGNQSRAFQTAIYAQEELGIHNFIWRGGIRYNYTKNNIELVDGGAPGSSSKAWSSLLWSTGLKYNATKSLSIFANAGNSFLTPGLKQTGGTIKLSEKGIPGHNGQLPNPDLKPESGIGFDIGTDMNPALKIKVSVRIFYLAISDAIIDNVVSQDPSQTQSVNAGKSTSAGAEIEFSHAISENIHWFLNYTYMRTKVREAGTVPFAPDQVFNAGIDFATSFGFTISPYLNYNNGFYDNSDKTSRNFFKPGALLNINASQVLTKDPGYRIELFGQFYNVTNNTYEMPWQFQDPGFSMMAGIRVTF